MLASGVNFRGASRSAESHVLQPSRSQLNIGQGGVRVERVFEPMRRLTEILRRHAQQDAVRLSQY